MVHVQRIWLFLALLIIAAPARAELIGIDNDLFQDLLDSGTPVVDVRRPDEWADTGVVAGSHLITFFDDAGRYDASQWMAEFTDVVNADEPFILICHSGVRTSIIGKWLGKQLSTVYHFEDGIHGWITEKRRVVAATPD